MTSKEYDKELEEIIEDIVSSLAWNGSYEDAGQRVISELETERAKRQIQALIDTQVRLARIDELNQLYDEAESPEQYDTCDVIHDHRIAERIRELTENTKAEDKV